MWRHGANEMPLMTHRKIPNMKTDTAHPEPAKEKANEPLTSHDLLAVIDANFDRGDIEARWATCGYTIEAAKRAKAEYERIACEQLSFDDVDTAITESDHSYGMFPQRIQWFFKGWILSANV